MTTPTSAILGIDLGTTEVKVGLVGLDGRLLAISRAGYALSVGHVEGWAEQDPAAWWSAVVVAVRALHPPEPVDVVVRRHDAPRAEAVAREAKKGYGLLVVGVANTRARNGAGSATYTGSDAVGTWPGKIGDHNPNAGPCAECYAKAYS